MTTNNRGRLTVRARPHPTDANATQYRVRSAGGTAVSVRTSHGAVDYIRIGAGNWGGSLTHDEAQARYAALRAALASRNRHHGGGVR